MVTLILFLVFAVAGFVLGFIVRGHVDKLQKKIDDKFEEVIGE